MKNPWKRLSSRTVYQNPWIKVREDRVIRPDEKKGIYGVIVVNDSVATVAVTKKQEIFLIKQWRYTLGYPTIELPWGGSKKNETPLAAAKRELAEEAGLKAKKWKLLGSVEDYPGISTERAHIFLARELSKVKRRLDGTEELALIKVPFKKAWAWVLSGTIRDAVTTTALLKAKNYLKL